MDQEIVTENGCDVHRGPTSFIRSTIQVVHGGAIVPLAVRHAGVFIVWSLAVDYGILERFHPSLPQCAAIPKDPCNTRHVRMHLHDIHM